MPKAIVATKIAGRIYAKVVNKPIKTGGKKK